MLIIQKNKQNSLATTSQYKTFPQTKNLASKNENSIEVNTDYEKNQVSLYCILIEEDRNKKTMKSQGKASLRSLQLSLARSQMLACFLPLLPGKYIQCVPMQPPRLHQLHFCGLPAAELDILVLSITSDIYYKTSTLSSYIH